MITTLANLLSNNHGLRVFCDACKSVADVDFDVPTLIRRMII